MRPCQTRWMYCLRRWLSRFSFHYVKLVKLQLNFDELVKALGGQLGAKYNASSEPVVTYDYQNTQYSGSIVVGTPSEKINVWLENHNFCHESKSNTYVPTATHSRSRKASIKCQILLQGHCEDWRYVNRRLHFCQGDWSAWTGVNKLVSFGQSHAEESRRLRAKSALVEGVCWQNTCFLPCFQPACLYVHYTSAQCTIDDRQSFTWHKPFGRRAKSPRGKEFPASSACQHVVLCVLGCTRATLMYSMCSSRFPSWCGRCESVYMGVDLDENWVCTESTRSMVVVVALDTVQGLEKFCVSSTTMVIKTEL